MTLQPKVIVNGQPAANIQVTPSTSTTPQSTITAAGTYYAAAGPVDTFEVCVTSYVSGSAVVAVNAGSGVNASLFGSGGGSGTVTSVTFTGDGTVLSSTPSSAVTTSGTLTAALATAAADSVLCNNTATAATPLYCISATLGVAGSSAGSLTLDSASSVTKGITITDAAGIVTNGTNEALLIAPNGTAPAIFNVGALSTPSIQTAGMASNTGLYSPTTAQICWDSAGLMIYCMTATGNSVSQAGSYNISASASANGSAAVTFNGTGTGGTQTAHMSTVILLPQCKITSAITLSGTTAVVCSWTLPNSAQTWAWQCSGTYNITAGTAPGLTLQMNAAQAPTSETGNALVGTVTSGGAAANAQVFLAGSGTSTSAGVQTILASALSTITTLTSAPWSSSGTIQASATSGTFAIQAVLSGTGTPAGTISVGSTCTLY
jgi:hypothetical protein